MPLDNDLKAEIIGKFAQSEGDTGSPEVQIALITRRVSDLTEHLTQEVRLGGILLDEQPTLHFVRIRTFADHPVSEGLEELIYFSGCSLRASDPAVVLASTEESSFGDLDLDQELDDDEAQGSLPIAVSSEAAGRLVVVGDCNIAANGYIEEGDNMKFVIQTIEWLLYER